MFGLAQQKRKMITSFWFILANRNLDRREPGIPLLRPGIVRKRGPNYYGMLVREYTRLLSSGFRCLVAGVLLQMAHLDTPYEERAAVKDHVDEDQRARQKAEEVEVREQVLGHLDLEPPQEKACVRGRRSPGPELAVEKNRRQPACM